MGPTSVTASASSMCVLSLVVGEGSIPHDDRGQFGMITNIKKPPTASSRLVQAMKLEKRRVQDRALSEDMESVAKRAR
jgi:hypothetical protein